MDCGNKSYVCVYLFDTAYYALCDSGSPVTIINYDIVPNELYAFIEPTNTSLVGANGSNLDVVGSLNTVLNFNPNSPEFETKMIVAKNLCEGILIGGDSPLKNE